MNQRLIPLILCCIFILSACPLNSKSNDRTSLLYKEFCNKTGFIGDCSFTAEGRIFSELNGKFNLPLPNDSLDVMKNADSIKNVLFSIYQSQGSKFNLRLIDFSHLSKVASTSSTGRDFP